MKARKIIMFMHRWLSIPFGVLIFVILFSGMTLIFEKEITGIVEPEFYVVNAGDNHARLPFFSTMFELHRWFLSPPNQATDGVAWGKLATGVTTVVMVFILLSGLILWILTYRRSLAKGLKLRFNKGWRLFWRDLHVVGGFYTSLFLLVMALTGLTWAFPKYRTAFYGIFGAEAPVKGVKPKVEAVAPSGKTYKAEAKEFSKVESDLQSVTPDKTEKGIVVKKAIYEVHTGKWGGMATKVLYLIVMMIGLFLPISGYYMFLKKEIKRLL